MDFYFTPNCAQQITADKAITSKSFKVIWSDLVCLVLRLVIATVGFKMVKNEYGKTTWGKAFLDALG